MSDKKCVSLVVPTLNCSYQVPNFIKALRALEGQELIKEIIFVDNGSNDDTKQIIERSGLGVVVDYLEMKSPYPCRNFGISLATGDYIALLDVKCEPTTFWLICAHDTAVRTSADIVIGPRNYLICEQDSSAQICSSIMFTPVDIDLQRGGFPAGAIFMKASVPPDFGNFPEDIRSNGDTVWSNMVIELGATVIFEEKCSVTYRAKEKSALLSQGLRIGFGNRLIFFSQGKSALKIALIAIWNMRPDNFDSIKKRSSAIGVDLNAEMICRVWFEMWRYKIYRGLGRMGFKKVFGVRAD